MFTVTTEVMKFTDDNNRTSSNTVVIYNSFIKLLEITSKQWNYNPFTKNIQQKNDK